ncbi:hypothetical protein L1987_28095 [Smallanthus sonchifolius]|uniref:Uncharacterized protein n=1 Tax=Smallanthus sonchifolius TaxID=185202 RepID=A0ACB9IDV5_9ASTR|nr:hypothetical protein L1987_28095 [Smallanthus sonchifolius]
MIFQRVDLAKIWSEREGFYVGLVHLMGTLHRYTKQSDISRSRVWFFQGEKKIMLYTERAHFYHRFKIRGIQNLIIYSLPERKEFYPEIVNMLEGSHSMNCTVLF